MLTTDRDKIKPVLNVMNYFHKFFTGASEICVHDMFIPSRGVYSFTSEIAYTGSKRSRIVEVYAVEGLCPGPNPP